MRINQRFGRRRLWLLLVVLLSFSLTGAWARRAGAQGSGGRIISDHVALQISPEREWLGREVILDLERCWRFINGITGLPRKIFISIIWNDEATSMDVEAGNVRIGMRHAVMGPDLRSFLLHEAAHEISRLGLLTLSRETAATPKLEFLYDGMAEILVHDFDRPTRSLDGAWVVAQLMDRMSLLTLEKQAVANTPLSGRHDLITAAPGITFLLTCRELYGRDRLLKFFDSLGRKGLKESLVSAFRTTPAAAEGAWLKMVREYAAPEEVTVTSAEDAPALQEATLMATADKTEAPPRLKIVIADARGNLSANGVFVHEENGGFIRQAQADSEKGKQYYVVELPTRPVNQQGKFDLWIVAVDGAGNVRKWRRSFAL
jgi:hypothetical protein